MCNPLKDVSMTLCYILDMNACFKVILCIHAVGTYKYLCAVACVGLTVSARLYVSTHVQTPSGDNHHGSCPQ